MKQIEIYTTLEKKVEIDINLENETVWLKRNQISLFFNRDIKTISNHVNNILKRKNWIIIQLSQKMRQME